MQLAGAVSSGRNLGVTTEHWSVTSVKCSVVEGLEIIKDCVTSVTTNQRSINRLK